jgi:hypothetical protein
MQSARLLALRAASTKHASRLPRALIMRLAMGIMCTETLLNVAQLFLEDVKDGAKGEYSVLRCELIGCNCNWACAR